VHCPVSVDTSYNIFSHFPRLSVSSHAFCFTGHKGGMQSDCRIRRRGWQAVEAVCVIIIITTNRPCPNTDDHSTHPIHGLLLLLSLKRRLFARAGRISFCLVHHTMGVGMGKGSVCLCAMNPSPKGLINAHYDVDQSRGGEGAEEEVRPFVLNGICSGREPL